MRYVPRRLTPVIRRAASGFPVVILTGPRRSGKTTLLRRSFPRASYLLLEDPDIVGQVRGDPRAFIESLKPPVILDEIQNVPELMNYIRTRVDNSGSRSCQWFLTGSQEPGLMKGVTESMAGRAAVFQLLPFSRAESDKVGLLRGGFPEVLDRPKLADIWFRSYLQTYLERDIRSISSIRDLTTFRRFLSLAASRIGQILNRSEMAAPLGVSVPTISEWLNLLEATHQILLVPPYFENFGKRLIKSPKLYFTDTGLAAFLLGLENKRMLERSPFYGPLFESYAASEIVKAQFNAGLAKQVYFFRDVQGLEVDFLLPGPGGKLLLMEAKARMTVKPEDASAILRLKKSLKGHDIESYVVGLPSRTALKTSVLRPGVKAATIDDLHSIVTE